MQRCGSAPFVIVLLVALALPVAAGSVAAHPLTKVPPLTPPSPVTLPSPVSLEGAGPPPAVSGPSVAPDSTSTFPLAVAGLLGLGVVVMRRWPRQAWVASFILLLTIFAFENALHSVHHGFDAKQSEECAVAALSAHLAAVSVDRVVETAFIPVVAAAAGQPEVLSPVVRLLGSDQDRAPPVLTA